ncbi:DNA-processing protein DprA [Ihubacter sp. mB4P-1]|uniref:DNA-processing protein DprA n=1 Tax=Ihubacter sp. mB4P-1 TaxID=3242370 RepID=UPI00137B5F3A
MKGSIQKVDSAFPVALTAFTPDIETIYFDGDLSCLERRCVAVVGSRRCTQYGRTVARMIGRRMAENDVTLVSGLAKGIDTAAHLGALEAGGKTVAVLGGGTDTYYPPENKGLQQQIAREGLLLSERWPEYAVKPYDFPKRNRVIAALAESVAVVEAGNRSGALITAECAAEMGKRVYAVPGNITSLYSFGTNKLIRENVTPLILLDDLLIDMGVEPQGICMKERLGKDEQTVFNVIKSGGEITVDEIHHKTNMKPSEINGIIAVLEMKGIIFSSMGKIFVAKF